MIFSDMWHATRLQKIFSVTSPWISWTDTNISEVITRMFFFYSKAFWSLLVFRFCIAPLLQGTQGKYCEYEQSFFIRMFWFGGGKTLILISCLCMSHRKSNWTRFSPPFFSRLRGFILYGGLTGRTQTLNHQWGGWTIKTKCSREPPGKAVVSTRRIVKKCCRWLQTSSARLFRQHKWVTYFFQVNALNGDFSCRLTSQSCLIIGHVAQSMKCLFCN